MEHSQEQKRIEDGLRRIRYTRISLGVVVITFVPVVYLLFLLQLPERVIITTGTAWVCLGVILELFMGFSRCPACRGFFHVRGMSGNIFTRKCMNCGVPLKPQK